MYVVRLCVLLLVSCVTVMPVMPVGVSRFGGVAMRLPRGQETGQCRGIGFVTFDSGETAQCSAQSVVGITSMISMISIIGILSNH